ncbi:hypothetical protein [Acaryochloris marina]|uniref:hypothetical protein n=1 Tax=Acaryochloris marina TaxID=155978 RepID=UPI001BAFD564|nr:hypothetical protein [Acaryochloris marina]QUY45762.1 hypothetical protein I1H34_28860 [Acaryochloris marina S15]
MATNILATWNNVEARLDIPFRRNMVDLLLEMARDQTADPHKITTWMLTTSTCICNAIFGLDNPRPLLSLYFQALLRKHPDTVKQITQIYTNGDLNEFSPVIADRDEFIGLLWAAGSTFANGELTLKDHKIDFTKASLKRFHSVWKAPIRKFNNPTGKLEYPIRW